MSFNYCSTFPKDDPCSHVMSCHVMSCLDPMGLVHNSFESAEHVFRGTARWLHEDAGDAGATLVMHPTSLRLHLVENAPKHNPTQTTDPTALGYYGVDSGILWPRISGP